VNREHMKWLLQTIKDPQDAQRFLLAQYQRGRISLQLLNEVSPEGDAINPATNPLSPAMVRWAEHVAMALVFANAW
jgi:hypothetical protein